VEEELRKGQLSVVPGDTLRWQANKKTPEKEGTSTFSGGRVS
jgi:hypothetical protein